MCAECLEIRRRSQRKAQGLAESAPPQALAPVPAVSLDTQPALPPPPDAAPLAPVAEDEILGPLDRPRTRGECEDGPRPCGFFTCHYHILTLVRTGAIQEGGRRKSLPVLNHLVRKPAAGRIPETGLPPLPDHVADQAADSALALMETLGCSCVLDLADERPRTLKQIGDILGLIRERVRQIEAASLAKLRESGITLGLDES